MAQGDLWNFKGDSKAASALGLVVTLDISDSAHYDLKDVRLLEWIMHMVESSRFGSFLIEPPCTTFSAAAFPMVRSYRVPLGFCRSHPKTLEGNTLAFRGFILLRHGRRHSTPCGLLGWSVLGVHTCAAHSTYYVYCIFITSLVHIWCNVVAIIVINTYLIDLVSTSSYMFANSSI